MLGEAVVYKPDAHSQPPVRLAVVENPVAVP